MVDFLFILAGFAGLLVCGGFLVNGSVGIARSMGVSPMVIGLTLVGFGTSAPELVTSLEAAFAGSPGIAVGNIVGSNIANILLILGVAALICPLVVQRSAVARDGLVMLAASVACVLALSLGVVTRGAGLALFAGLAVYLVWTLRTAQAADVPEFDEADRPLWQNAVMLVGGIGGTIISAKLLVSGAVSVALALDVSETVIGLTIVAVGTSLPELVTSAIAARRGQSDIALGNIIGSNIFNILGILGITAAIVPIDVPVEVMRVDVWVMLGAAVLLLVMARSGWLISRLEGGVLMASYAAYTTFLVVTA